MSAMLREILVGLVLGAVVLGPFACGGGVPAVVRCKLQALEVLPDDPGMVTIYDAIDVIERVRACRRLGPDGGS